MKMKALISLGWIAIVFALFGCGRQAPSGAKKDQALAKPVCASPATGQEAVNRLVAAAESGDAVAVKSNLDCGADPNGFGTPSSATALMLAAQNGYSQVVRALLDHGADPNLAQEGNTALIAASLWGYSDVVGVLVDKGAAVDAKDAHGKTALYYASLAGNDDAAELLVKHGANAKQKTKTSTNDFLSGTVTAVDAKNKVVKVLISNALMLAEKGAEVPLDASAARYMGVKGIDDLKKDDAVTVHYAMSMTIGSFNFSSFSGTAGASYKIQQLAVHR